MKQTINHEIVLVTWRADTPFHHQPNVRFSGVLAGHPAYENGKPDTSFVNVTGVRAHDRRPAVFQPPTTDTFTVPRKGVRFLRFRLP